MAHNDNGDLNRSALASDTSDLNNSLLQKVTKRVTGLIPSSLSKWFGSSSKSTTRRREDLEEESDDADDSTTQAVHPPPKKRVKLPSAPNIDHTAPNTDYTAPSFDFTVPYSSTPMLHNDMRHLQPGPSGYTRHSNATRNSNSNATRHTSVIQNSSTSRFEETEMSSVPNTTSRYDGAIPGTWNLNASRYEDSVPGTSSAPMRNPNSTSRYEDAVPGTSSIPIRNSNTKSRYADAETAPGPSSIPMVNGDDKSDSGESTSGYSSVLVGHQRRKDATASKNADTSNPTSEKLFNVSLDNTRSLFSTQNLRNQKPSLSSRRPAFNSSVFSSPTFLDRTLTTREAINSPFYSGRTMFGGASAYRRHRVIFPREHVINAAAGKNTVEMKPVNETENMDSVNLSRTARRILDALEHFSTPVQNARKIPAVSRRKETERKTPYARENRTAANRQLLVPEVPDLLKMKQMERLQDSTVQVRRVATTSKSVLNSQYSVRMDNETKTSKHVNKMKSKLTSIRDKTQEDVVEEVKLPEVELQITNLPKFDFILPPPPPAIAQSTSPKPNLDATQFKFSSPIIVKQGREALEVSPINSFKFSEPLNAKTTANETKLPTFTFKADSSTAPRRKQPNKNNGQNSDVGFVLPKPVTLATGSVMDVLHKPDSLMAKFKPDVGTWECTACLVRNIPTATRCQACETQKESQKPKMDLAKFQMTADKWECNVCLVRNENASSSCVACITPRPNASKGASTNSFGVTFKASVDTWECTSCLVRNKNEQFKCVACETPKPGSVSKESKPTLIMPMEVKTTSGFEGLIKKQQAMWECSSCMLRNTADKLSCACCEAPKPGTQVKFSGQTPESSFKFGIDKSTESSPGVTLGTTKSTGTTTQSFTFGIKPTETSTTTPQTFMFGVKPTETSTTTPQTFTFGVKPTETSTTTPLSGAFGMKQPEQLSTTMPQAVTFGTKLSEMPKTAPLATSLGIKPTETPTTPLSGAGTKQPETSKTTPLSTSFGIKSAETPSVPLSTSSGIKFVESPLTTSPLPAIFGIKQSETSIKTPQSVGKKQVETSTTTPQSVSFGKKQLETSITSPQSISFGKKQLETSTTSPQSVSFGSKPTSITTPQSISLGMKPSETTIATTHFLTKLVETSKSQSITSGTATAMPLAFTLGTKPAESSSNVGTSSFSFGASSKDVKSSPKPTPNSALQNIFSNSASSPAGTKPASTSTVTKPTFSFGAPSTSPNPNPLVSVIFGNTTTFKSPPPSTFSFTSTAATSTSTFTFTSSSPSKVVLPVPKFSFGGSGLPFDPTPATKPKDPAFSFDKPASTFSFGATTTSSPIPGAFTFANSKPANLFNSPTSTSQNGGFNFSSTATATAPAPSFKFAPNNQTPTTPTGFGLTSNQAGSESSAASPAVPPGVFSFGANSSTSNQQQTNTFNPDVKPSFNFTGGSVEAFTAQSTSQSGPIPARRIRKAIRRTQPR